MRAFASECQAHLKYQLAAEAARQQKLYVIADLFETTADQEKEHAQVFYNHLSECSGQTVTVNANFPVAVGQDICELLRAAIANEAHEHGELYPHFAEVARNEGFEDIAAHFEMTASIENTHEQKFTEYLDLLSDGKLFSSDQSERWVCTNCGYIYEGSSAPEQCPVCGEAQGYYLRENMSN